MLTLNVNEEKQLNFDSQIGGVQTDQIHSFLRIEIDEIEYGFPAHIGEDYITVDIPPLRTIAPKKLKEAQEVNVKLEVVADGHYLVPWKNTFVISNPLIVEAKMSGGSDYRSNTVALVENEYVEEKPPKPKEKKSQVRENREYREPIYSRDYEEDMTEKIVNKLAEKLDMMFEKHQESGRESRKTQPVSKAKPKSKQIKESHRFSKEAVANITEEGVYNYMARAGTKNPIIQKLVYEQAETAAGSSKPVDVLRQVAKILKKN